MRTQELTENAASEIVGRDVDPDNGESVARGIRRHLKASADKPEATVALSVRAGLGALYGLLSERMEALDHEALKLCHTQEQFSAVAEKTESIKNLLAHRLTELEAITPEQRTVQARQLLCGLEDPMLDPSAIAEREVQVVKALMERAKDLLSSIDMWRTMRPSFGQ